MPPDMRSAKWLEDVRDAASFILEVCASLDADAFDQNRLVRQAVERNFQIIGEALRRLERHAPVVAGRISPLPRIIAFRNIIVHAYDGIDPAVMWQVIRDDLPPLLQTVEDLLKDVDAGR